ncbi:hypothetical protein NDU88_000273 [Pleurodeles waltl]|uniref:Uncharacterized protein n=1 Tax=Pleurodeles waltl TaxID=8319 RepID=A0AAV7SWU2_PLEWA|nr:hypothetical protein NDU88_000273 [Pleurodeles waltl]
MQENALSPEKEYPGGSPEGTEAIPEEAGAHGRRNRQDDSETVRVLDPVQEREEVDSVGAGGQWRTENGTDGQVSEVENIRGLRGAKVLTATETVIVKDVLEGGDMERLATFWEKRGPYSYGLQPERDTGGGIFENRWRSGGRREQPLKGTNHYFFLFLFSLTEHQRY